MLGNLIESYPYIMLEHVSRLKELLDYFTFMHVKVASSIVTAISPLIKFSRDLQVLVLILCNLKDNMSSTRIWRRSLFFFFPYN